MVDGLLGAGFNKAAIYTRGGGTQLLPLEAVSALDWGRSRNAFSTSTVTVTPDDDNFNLLGDVHTWAHELVLFRDGARVWEGPIRYIDQGKSSCIFYGVDVAGWLAKRDITAARQVAEGSEVPITSEMELDLITALTPDDPNVLAHRLRIPHTEEAMITRDVAAYSGKYDADFTGMAGQGGNFTVIGRRVIIYPDQILLGRLNTLQAENHTTAEVRVVEDGDALATFAAAANTDGLVGTAAATGTDVGAGAVSTFYGRHDTIVAGDGLASVAALNDVAAAAIAQLYPAPNQIVMPSDSALKASAPFTIDQLVPGVMLPVETSATGRRVSATMILDSMKVTQSSAGEVITITPVAASAYAGASEGA